MGTWVVSWAESGERLPRGVREHHATAPAPVYGRYEPIPSTPWAGKAHPRGVAWYGLGVNFALFSEHAQRFELCLFDGRGREFQGAARLYRPPLKKQDRI